MSVLHSVLLFLQDLLINKNTGRAYDADSRPDSDGDQIGLQLAHLAQGENSNEPILDDLDGANDVSIERHDPPPGYDAPCFNCSLPTRRDYHGSRWSPSRNPTVNRFPQTGPQSLPNRSPTSPWLVPDEIDWLRKFAYRVIHLRIAATFPYGGSDGDVGVLIAHVMSRPKGNRDERFCERDTTDYIIISLFFSSPPFRGPSVAYEHPRPWSPVALRLQLNRSLVAIFLTPSRMSRISTCVEPLSQSARI